VSGRIVPAARRVTPLAILLAIALPVFFVFLGANSIWDTNEAFYVETPRQMVRTGDYVNPSFNDAPRFNKPVLSYWIVAGLYRAFGESVAVQRVGIAFGALAIVFSAFVVGRALRSTAAGLLAALIVATAPRVVWFSRRIFIDIYLTAFTSLALAALVMAQSHPRHRRRYLIFMYVALGLGVLTKGPVAIAIPGFVGLVWLTLEGRLGELRRLMLLPGAAVVLAIVLPWYVAVYAQHGWAYITSFLFEENFGRYATTAMTPGGRDLTFYIPVLLTELFPWAPLVIAPLVGTAVLWWRAGRDAGGSLHRLLGLWIVGFVAIFSFSQTKEDLYIFPVVPAVAALVAIALIDALDSSEKRVRLPRLLHGLFLLVCALCVLLAPVLWWLFGPSAGFYALPEMTPYALLLGLTGAASLALWQTGRHFPAVAALAGGFVVLNYLFVGSILIGVERTKPVPPLARIIAERAGPDAKLGQFNMALQSFVYYADRGGVEVIGIPEQAQAFFLDEREAWALMGAEEWETVRQLVPDVCVVDRRPLSIFDARLPDILNRVPPKEVLLVRNQCPHPILGSQDPSSSRTPTRSIQTNAGNAGIRSSRRASVLRRPGHQAYATAAPAAATR
jgi:4-amino-4-deoxy-L-arabinose transferase-like glycosyltransferase